MRRREFLKGTAATDRVSSRNPDHGEPVCVRSGRDSGERRRAGADGDPVKDGVHGFSIPRLKIDVHAEKWRSRDSGFHGAPAGRYEIACSEFCGTGQMKAALVSIGPTPTNRR